MRAPAKPKNKGGRPRVDIDMDMLRRLAEIQCTAEECAKVLRTSPDTLDRRVKEEGYAGFAEFHKKHSEDGKASLRRAQYKLATEQLNATMLIWLGKQHLGQSDKVIHGGDAGNPMAHSHKIEFHIIDPKDKS